MVAVGVPEIVALEGVPVPPLKVKPAGKVGEIVNGPDSAQFETFELVIVTVVIAEPTVTTWDELEILSVGRCEFLPPLEHAALAGAINATKNCAVRIEVSANANMRRDFMMTP
jgi:hypothetical protein